MSRRRNVSKFNNEHKAIQENPHTKIREYLGDYEDLCRNSFTADDLLVNLHDPSKRTKFHKIEDINRSALHRGQLKLLVGEIAFLHTIVHKDDKARGTKWNCLYAGAAPGNHIIILAELYQNVIFHLFDTVEFHPELIKMSRTNDRIILYHEYVTEKIARNMSTLSNKLFIADIRTEDEADQERAYIRQQMIDEITEQHVQDDMELQKRLAIEFNPLWSSLKFRLPWTAHNVRREDQVTEYFHGNLYLQAFPPTASTETRLVSSNREIRGEPRRYNNVDYDEAMAYHNNHTRSAIYRLSHVCPSSHLRDKKIDQCFDCTLFLVVMYTISRKDYQIRAGWILDELQRLSKVEAKKKKKANK